MTTTQSTATPTTQKLGIATAIAVSFLVLSGLIFSAEDVVQGSTVRMMYIHASAEIGVLFVAISLVTGSLWGRLTWGTFWVWDARLTSTAFLFITYIGYLAVRRLGGTFTQRARRSAIMALLAVLEIPLVHFSVNLWRTLHQKASIADPNAKVQLDGFMLFTLFWGLVSFSMLFAWLLIHRQRLMALEDAVQDQGLDRAIQERRTEAGR